MGPTSSTTVMIIEPIPASSGLSGEHNIITTITSVATNSDEIVLNFLYSW